MESSFPVTSGPAVSLIHGGMEPVSFYLHPQDYADWKSVGVKRGVYTDHDIAAFLLKYYREASQLFPLGLSLCKMCGTQLSASCVHCAAGEGAGPADNVTLKSDDDDNCDDDDTEADSKTHMCDDNQGRERARCDVTTHHRDGLHMETVNNETVKKERDDNCDTSGKKLCHDFDHSSSKTGPKLLTRTRKAQKSCMTQKTYKTRNLTKTRKICKTRKALNKTGRIKNSPKAVKEFQCEKCNKKFMSPRALRTHQHVHTGIKEFACDLCQKTFVANFTLKLHVQNVHMGEKPFACELCNQRFVSQHALALHKMKHSSEKQFACDICGKTYQYECSMKVHKRSHLDEKPFKCDLCEKAYICKAFLTRHKLSHDAPKYVCDICGKAFHFITGLNSHSVTHIEDKPYLCDICSKTFSTVRRLKAHHRVVHEKHTIVKCKTCHLEMPRSKLRHHMRVEHRGQSLVCNICNKSFTRSDSLHIHKQTYHSSGPSFPCQYCGKCYHTEKVLSLHRKIKHEHENDKPYKCRECGKAFMFQSYLKTHERSHTTEKLCTLCNKEVKHLDRHLKASHKTSNHSVVHTEIYTESDRPTGNSV